MMDVSYYNEVSSTNRVLKDFIKTNKPSAMTAIMAGCQTKGRGQGTNTWQSEKDKNLLISYFIPGRIPVADHFFITILASLAVQRALFDQQINVHIKWPNDMYAGLRKIAGILIENSIMGSEITHSIIGLGLNVNQIHFEETLPNPVSMKQLTRQNYSVENLARNIGDILRDEFEGFSEKGREAYLQRYNQQLFARAERRQYADKDGVFTGTLEYVDQNGILTIRTVEGAAKCFVHGEVKYMPDK